MSRRIASLVGRSLGGLARLGFDRPRVAIGLAALLCALSVPGVARLGLDTDLARLLPDDFASVQALSVLQDRVGAVGYVVVAIEGGTGEARRSHGRWLAREIESLPSIRYVDVERPVDWFVDRALYFVERADLEVVADRLAARAGWEKRRHNPMYLDLEASAPPPIDMTDLRAQYTRAGGQGWLSRQTNRYYESHDMLAIFARPAQRATETDFAAAVTADVQTIVDARASSAPELTARLTGRYQKQVDQKRRIQSDLSTASALAACLSLVYLLVHFRSIAAVVRVLAPLFVGLWWTFGIAGVWFGSLNILTGFIGAILLGLGVDHGIHLLSAWHRHRRAGAVPTDAITATFSITGRAVMTAAVTTAAALAGLAFSEFRAFHEFGVVAAVGTAAIVLAYALLLPALLALRPGVVPRTDRPPSSPLVGLSLRHPRRTFGLALFALLLLAIPGTAARFDYDFAALEDSRLPSFRLDGEVNRLLGYSQTPTLVLTDDLSHSRAVADALRRRAAAPDSTIDIVVTEADLVPADQSARRDVIGRIGRIVGAVEPRWLDDDAQREARRTLLQAAATPPFTAADLPDAVRRQFTSRDGGGFVMAFPGVSLSDGPQVAAFAAEVRATARSAPAAGEAMVLADILGMVRREGPTLLTLTVAGVLLALWLLLGRIGPALGALVTAGLTLAVTIGAATLAGQPLNYLNIIMIPVIVGIAVDGAVHLLDREADDPATFTEIGRAISGSLFTTGFGFGALLIADHPGLQSLGRLALIGLAANALVTLILLPPLAVALSTPTAHSEPTVEPS